MSFFIPRVTRHRISERDRRSDGEWCLVIEETRCHAATTASASGRQAWKRRGREQGTAQRRHGLGRDLRRLPELQPQRCFGGRAAGGGVARARPEGFL